MAVKTEVIQIEERDFTKIILFVSGDKGFYKHLSQSDNNCQLKRA